MYLNNISHFIIRLIDMVILIESFTYTYKYD